MSVSASALARSLAALALLATVGCAKPVEFVEPPSRKADLYPYAMRSDGLVVAVDPITDPRRSTRYFGVDLNELGILPAHVLVSNHGDRVMAVEPADVLVSQGRDVVDPIPHDKVATIYKRSRGGFSDEVEEQIDAYFARIAFADNVVAPGDNIHGIIFFDVGAVEPPRETDGFRLVSLYPRSGLRMRLATTELESGQRLHFGPFNLKR